MCVEKVEAFSHNGTLYPTELAAQEAALASIAGKLQKEYSANFASGLVDLSDKLVPVLTRLKELRDRLPVAAALEG